VSNPRLVLLLLVDHFGYFLGHLMHLRLSLPLESKQLIVILWPINAGPLESFLLRKRYVRCHTFTSDFGLSPELVMVDGGGSVKIIGGVSLILVVVHRFAQ
jgi:hypothetical protein